MEGVLVAGIGEILWDVLDDGEKLGGAPVNFAFHVSALGGVGIPISTVGDDDRGRRARSELEGRGIRTEAVSLDPARPTGSVKAEVDGRGVARYTIAEAVAWDHLRLNAAALSLAGELRAVFFGTLAQRSPVSRKAVHGFLDRLPAGVLKICDLNLRRPHYDRRVVEASLERCNALKLNDEELATVRGMFGLPEDEHAAVDRLVAAFGLRLAVLTRGGNGSLLATPAEASTHGGFPSEVADTIGAGDAFTAATTLGFLLGHDLDAVNAHANLLAAFVCSRKGAMPAIPAAFKLI